MKHKLAALCGLGVALAALAPPMRRGSEQLFSLHMTQHLLLIAAAAPLLAVSGLIAPWRNTAVIRQWLDPIVAWTGFVGVFLFWHWPAAFHWSAGSQGGTLLEQSSIFLSALMFWSVALGPPTGERFGYGARALYIMTAAISTDLPGVIMVFSPQAFCVMPHENAAAWGISPLDDQHIAGMLMWVPANMVFFSIATALFARWLGGAPAQPLHARAYSQEVP